MHPAAPTLQQVPCAAPVSGTPKGEPAGEEEGRGTWEHPLDHPLPFDSQVEQEQLCASPRLPGSPEIEECGKCQPQLFPVPREMPVEASFQGCLEAKYDSKVGPRLVLWDHPDWGLGISCFQLSTLDSASCACLLQNPGTRPWE